MAAASRRLRLSWTLVAAALVTAGGASARTPPAPCRAPAYRQFDFFLGEWDASDAGQTTVKAHNSVTRMLDGCAVREVYRRVDGYEGESFSLYDAARRVWHQSWTTNRGELLLLEGGLHDGAMVLIGRDAATTGADALLRGVWRRQPDGSVRETADRSTDGGVHWTPVFDIDFHRADRGPLARAAEPRDPSRSSGS